MLNDILIEGENKEISKVISKIKNKYKVSTDKNSKQNYWNQNN